MEQIDIAKLSLDEVRDAIAEAQGYTPFYRVVGAGTWNPPDQPGEPKRIVPHPVPASLDFAAKCLPEGWTWKRTSEHWWAYGPGDVQRPVCYVRDTNEPIDNLMRLALSCLLSSKP